MSERWAELRMLFDELVELDQDARLARLRQIGASDASLRQRLEAMLLADGSETGLNKYVEAAARSMDGTARRTEGDPLGLIGSNIGPYRIDCLLGAGGMGVVYQATDERLGRIVAVKFLPPVWSLNEQAKRRFLHEARAASSLDHTNVCTIYEADETPDGTLYIVMACYEGETLKARLERGTLRIDEALDLAKQVAQGLAAAHARDLVHRDVKPANLLITSDNTVKILDFGIAKAGDLGLTMPGERPGTAAYMAPEQADGGEVDSRADVWSLGVVLYEMLAGMRPAFGGVADAQSRLTEARPEVSPALARITGRCLARQPDDRYTTARDVTQALSALQAPIPATAPRGLSRTARAGIAVLALAAFAAVAALVAWQVHDRRIRIARMEAIPQIEQLANDNQIVEAFLLAEETARLAPEDPVLRGLVNRLSVPVDINSEPLGAEVSYQDYRTADGSFHTLGRTPLDSIRVPAPMSVLRWRVEQEGYDTLEIAETSVLGAVDFALNPVGEAPPGMHRVPAGSEHFQASEPNEVPAFWLDTYEVTNREFQEFVDAGGYDEPRYWTRALEAAGGDLSWEELTSAFRDATGRHGPAGWEIGRYVEGTEDHPVGGVSWFEAVAYAEFAGKSLPTAYHWRRATPWSPFGDMLLLSRFQADGSVPVGTSRAVGRYGHHDLAGNVGEWVWNEAPGEQRYILGGSWAEPSYIFMAHSARSPFERGPDFGFRLAEYGAPPPPELSEPVSIEPHDFSREVPVSDEIFTVYQSLFRYDPSPLDPRVESMDDSAQHWRRETVSFTAAYGGERVIAHLFLPRDVSPPYKTVVYVPGTAAFFVSSIDDASGEALFIPRSRRALIFPAYKGMLERGGGGALRGELSPRERRDQMIQSVNDLQRTVDYLETREDIDSGSLAYLGLSYGGEYGPIFTSISSASSHSSTSPAASITSGCPMRSNPGTTLHGSRHPP